MMMMMMISVETVSSERRQKERKKERKKEIDKKCDGFKKGKNIVL